MPGRQDPRGGWSCRRRVRAVGVFGLLAGCVAVAAPTAAQAAPTYLVTNTHDSGPGSLRAALLAIDASTSGGVADLRKVTGTIALASPLPALSGADQLLGPGAPALTVSGSGKHVVLTVLAGANVTVTGLRLAHGFSTAPGGAVNNAGALTLRRDVVTNSTTTTGTEYFTGGGGIASTGSLTLNDTTVSHNTAIGAFPADMGGHGGGVNSTGALRVVDSRIASNHSDLGGGGIFNGGTATVKASVLSANTTGTTDWGAGEGAGVENNPGVMTVMGSTINGNRGADYGGGLRNLGALRVIRSTVSGNQAGQGAGIANLGSGTLVVRSSTLTGNHGAEGAGLFLSGGGTTVLNTTITGNRAQSFGGGIYDDELMTLTASTVVGNSGGYAGGGVEEAGGGHNTSLKSTVIANNHGFDCSATVVDRGYNLDSDGTCGLSGSSQSHVQPLLGPLASNGGPTDTLLPEPGSPLLNKIPVADCTSQSTPPARVALDQRGVARPQGFACDVGAVEGQGLPVS